MNALYPGNSLVPSQSSHDAHYADPRRRGLLILGRLGIFYTWNPDTEEAQIEDVKLTPETEPANLWRNTDPGCLFSAAIHAVLTAQGSSFAELIAEHHDESQEQPV